MSISKHDRPGNSAPERRTAVLLDPHPLWLDGLARLVESLGIDVVGRTSQPSEAISLVAEHEPALLIVAPEAEDDELDGMGVLEQALTDSPSTRAIAVSSLDDRNAIEEALAAGVAAYVVKTALAEDITAVVRQVFGASVFLAGRPRDDAEQPSPSSTNGRAEHTLTRRESEILRLVAEGMSNAELARLLWLSEQTVKFHLSNIYRKLDVSNRTEASRWAQLNGLLPRRIAKAG
jgi:DNA-binding NarL/FixJ family response regulator